MLLLVSPLAVDDPGLDGLFFEPPDVPQLPSWERPLSHHPVNRRLVEPEEASDLLQSHDCWPSLLLLHSSPLHRPTPQASLPATAVIGGCWLVDLLRSLFLITACNSKWQILALS